MKKIEVKDEVELGSLYQSTGGVRLDAETLNDIYELNELINNDGRGIYAIAEHLVCQTDWEGESYGMLRGVECLADRIKRYSEHIHQLFEKGLPANPPNEAETINHHGA